MTEVFNLSAGEFVAVYSCDPLSAVVSAHAQSIGDYNTWDYGKYPVVVNDETVRCGDMTARIS